MGDNHPKLGTGTQPLCLFKLHLWLRRKKKRKKCRHNMVKSATLKSQMYDNVNGFEDEEDQT